MRETVVFNGRRYGRDTGSPRLSDRTYFRHGGRYLHRDVYESVCGPIPKGCEVHHIDGNAANNDPANLALRTAKGHHAEHWTKERSESQRRRAEAIRPLTVAWHRSPEGRAWHRKHALESAKTPPSTQSTCAHCGEPFVSKRRSAAYCSNKCKAAFRRKTGADNETRTCPECGAAFVANRFSRPRCCSQRCAQRRRRRNGRCVQPHS